MKGRKVFWVFYYPLVTLLLLEGALWLLGYRPYQHDSFQVSAQPSNWLEGDSVYGFRLGVGEFELAINKKLQFKSTHLKEGRRYHGPPTEGDSLVKIDLYGCSYAYGYGLDDSVTMAWRITTALPNASLRSWAVPGYGTTQCFLRLQAQLHKQDTPKVVVIAYASFHAERNSLNAEYRRSLSLGFSKNTHPQQLARFRYPYVDQSGNIQYQAWPGLYAHWPGRSFSALINAIQSNTEYWLNDNRKKQQRTEMLLAKIAQLGQKAGIQMVFFPLTQDKATQAMQLKAQEMGYEIVDAALDLSQTQFQNYPYDTHPNAEAHTHYAKAFVNWYKQSRL
ncbi:MAG: hypothetical protein AAF927_16425 [Bacteroidota bacterium]